MCHPPPPHQDIAYIIIFLHLISAFFPLSLCSFTRPHFSPSYPHANFFNRTSPCSTFFSFSAFIWHTHRHSHSHSLSCPSSLHRWVVIDYCTWIVWWNATRPPNILLSAAPDIPLPLCIADCFFASLLHAPAVTLPCCDVWIHIWDRFFCFSRPVASMVSLH